MNNFLDKESPPNEANLIGYLNGMLSTLETLNDGAYTGNTFEFSKIANLQNEPETSLHAALRHWKPGLHVIEDFFPELDKTFTEYCQQYARATREQIERTANVKPDDTIIEKILEATNYGNLKWNFYEALRLLLKESYTVYAVTLKGGGWYEASYKDYFIDCNGAYYFLHFGISD